MATIIVQDDAGKMVLEERHVHTCHLDSEPSTIQLLDRIEMALRDSERRRRRRHVRGVESYATVASG